MYVCKHGMYSDDKIKKEHHVDFTRVLKRLQEDPNTNLYRLKVIKDCIKRCEAK